MPKRQCDGGRIIVQLNLETGPAFRTIELNMSPLSSRFRFANTQFAPNQSMIEDELIESNTAVLEKDSENSFCGFMCFGAVSGINFVRFFTKTAVNGRKDFLRRVAS